jgi:tryptophan synthase alpha chain
MSNLKEIFNSQKCLIPYLTFGYPSISFTKDCVRACIENGADCIELGIPFSDPLADGPIIQKTHQKALTSGEDVSISSALEFVKDVKTETETPVIFMMSVNLIMQYGIGSFFEQAKECGLGGIVIPDLPVEEADEYLELSKKHGVSLILLISPLCSKKRLKNIAENANGFIYLISSTGLTGERNSFSDNLPMFVAKLKKETDIPICVGFGISNETHVDFVSSFSEGVIVGSHLKRFILENESDLPFALQKISERIRLFKSHLK